MDTAKTEDAPKGASKKTRRWGSRQGWFLAVFFTVAFSYLYSGMAYHGPAAANPTLSTIGWIIAGLSPLAAYLAFELVENGSRSGLRFLLALACGVGALFGLQYLGVCLIALIR